MEGREDAPGIYKVLDLHTRYHVKCFTCVISLIPHNKHE